MGRAGHGHKEEGAKRETRSCNTWAAPEGHLAKRKLLLQHHFLLSPITRKKSQPTIAEIATDWSKEYGYDVKQSWVSAVIWKIDAGAHCRLSCARTFKLYSHLRLWETWGFCTAAEQRESQLEFLKFWSWVWFWHYLISTLRIPPHSGIWGKHETCFLCLPHSC